MKIRFYNEEAKQFFFEHAGLSYDPKSETQRQGRLRCARRLATAEEFAKKHGWTAEWVADTEADPTDWDGEGPMGEEAFVCMLRNENGQVLATLGGTWDPTAEYQRVVEAELALEAMHAHEARNAAIVI